MGQYKPEEESMRVHMWLLHLVRTVRVTLEPSPVSWFLAAFVVNLATVLQRKQLLN